MKEAEYIIGIYNYVLSEKQSEKASAYYILYLLDQNGLMENHERPGPFYSLEELNQYAYSLCEEANAKKISLVSAEEYNTLLENTQQISEFQKDLLEKGSVLENIARKKKSILSRIF